MKRPILLAAILVALGAALALLLRGEGGRGAAGPGDTARAKGGPALPSAGALLGGSPRDRAQAKVDDGKALEELDRLDEAERAFQDAAALDTTFALPVARLGALRLVRGDGAAARPLLERAVALDPRLAEARFHLAFLLEEEGALGRAEAEYREAVGADSGYAEAYNNLGHLLIRLGRAGEAAAALEEGRRRDPKSEFLAKNLGRAYARLGRWDEARPLLEAALPLAGHDPEVLLDLACLRRASGNEAAAQTLMRQYAGAQRDAERRAAGESLFTATAAAKKS